MDQINDLLSAELSRRRFDHSSISWALIELQLSSVQMESLRGRMWDPEA